MNTDISQDDRVQIKGVPIVILNKNPLPFKRRIKELFYDYLVIIIYLLFLFGVVMICYSLFFGDIPLMSVFQAQMIATLTSVVPIILIFAYLDYSKDGSFGKRKAHLKLVYEKKTFKNSLIRNIIKFIPWQLGHISTIHGVYSNYDYFAIVLSAVSLSSALGLFLMAILREDKRHLGDLLAKTQVQTQE